MIRVLHVISAPAAGGAETYVRDLVRAQKALGSDPHIAFLGTAFELGRDPLFETDYLAQLDEARIPYFFIGHDCRRNLVKGIWRVNRYCRQQGITHYHSHLIYGLVFGAFLKVPRLFTEHSGRVRGSRFLRRRLNGLVEAYVAISKKCAKFLEDAVGRPTTTIFNGVDISRAVVNKRRGRSAGPFRLLSVGRLVPAKNYSLLIESLARMEALIDANFVAEIAGDGTPEAIAQLEAQAAEVGVARRVRFLGNRTDIANLMGSSDLFVMSSAWEGFPIVLLEAVAARLPFVATDVGGCGEIAEMTGAGLVVPRNDADALAKAILELLTDHTRRDAMRDAAANSSTRFSIEHSAMAHLELYKQTVRSDL